MVKEGTVSVKLNNQIGPYFQSHKGVRQGDPLSPLLFNIVADCLTRMVHAAQRNNLLCGLADHIIPKGVAILQYADDIIICLKDDLEGAINLKLLLYMYEKMSGLKINFEKSEVLIIGGDNNIACQYANIFNCQMGEIPLKYLGVPVSARRLRVVHWKNMEEKYYKKIDVWQGNSLTIGGRKWLINSSLANVPTYHMSMFLLLKTVAYRLEKGMRKFLQGGSIKKKSFGQENEY